MERRAVIVLALAWASLDPTTGLGAARHPQEPATFLADAFGGSAPAAGVMALDAAQRRAASDILGHPPDTARVRYWCRDTRCAFVLDEIAHAYPITAGIVVDAGRIERARVLVYRESRGAEVTRASFLVQLEGRALTATRTLDAPIDGITGATQSVAAMTRIARLALYLADQLAHAQEPGDGR